MVITTHFLALPSAPVGHSVQCSTAPRVLSISTPRLFFGGAKDSAIPTFSGLLFGVVRRNACRPILSPVITESSCVPA